MNGSPQSLLFVCSANVCRSPMMQFSYQEAAGDALLWPVASRGVRVVESMPVCDLVAEMMPNADVAGHSSRQATSRVLGRAAVVLAATPAESTALAQIGPEFRSKIFTFQQVRSLATRPVSAEERGLARVHGADERLREVAHVLNRRRGTEAEGRARASRRFSRPLSDTENVYDVHGDRPGRHRRALVQLREAVISLEAQLSSMSDLIRL